MDPYKILGVARSASDDEIKKAYRKLSKQYHPDNKQTGDEEKFKEISNAYETLSDKNKRVAYDNPGFNGPWSGGFNPFEDFFRGSSRKPKQNQPTDNGCEIHAQKDTTIKIDYEKKVECTFCGGRGGDHVDCSNCNGTGFVTRTTQMGFMMSQTMEPCPVCSGRGIKITKPCPNCNGQGYKIEKKSIEQYIPKGNYARTGFMYPNEGDFGGNLIIEVSVSDNN